MITFGELSQITSGIIGCGFFILFLGFTFLFVLGISRKWPNNLGKIAGLFLGMVVTYVFLQCALSIYDEEVTSSVVIKMVHGFAYLPAWVISIILLVLVILEVVLFSMSFRWDRNHITTMSIKEAVDSIPVGVCAYEKCGRLVLTNATMERLSVVMTGEMLLDGTLLEKSMREYPNKDMMGEKEVYLLPDGSVCIFSLENHSIAGHELTLLTAYDMSEEYNKTQILLQKRKSVEKLNLRLTEYNRDIVSIITSQEILNAKVKIHDELGAGLLAMKHYLVNGGNPVQKTEIINRLKNNLKFLQNEIQESKQDEYILIFSTANDLDVRIIVDGTLPEDEPDKHIIATAIHECFTNTVRHAKGDMLRINVIDEGREKATEKEAVVERLTGTKKAGEILVVFTNNGEKPTGPIVEKGGLASLRSMVEATGGTMEIGFENGFELSISLSKEIE